MSIQELTLNQLVLDMSIYPRTSVDQLHVRAIRLAIEAGTVLPPIVADEATRRVIDGFHRYGAYKMLYGLDHVVQVDLRSYESEAELWLESLNLNASHGRPLTMYERTNAILKAEQMAVSRDSIARALVIPEARINEVIKGRLAQSNGETVVLKRTVRHLANTALTSEQAETNAHLGGMGQTFYIKQVQMLLDTGMIDLDNESVRLALRALRESLDKVLLPVLS